jgi:hypothetical protein
LHRPVEKPAKLQFYSDGKVVWQEKPAKLQAFPTGSPEISVSGAKKMYYCRNLMKICIFLVKACRTAGIFLYSGKRGVFSCCSNLRIGYVVKRPEREDEASCASGSSEQAQDHDAGRSEDEASRPWFKRTSAGQ